MTVHDIRERFPELPNGAVAIFSGMAAASRPSEELTISEFSDRYRKVSAESGSPWPGDFRTDRVPYLREPQDCLHPDHPARRISCRWAAQLGKSTAIENWFCFIVDQSPGSMMIVLPTLEEATKFNRVKLHPTIEASPRIRHKVLPVSSRDEQGSTTAFKRYAGGFCQIVNAGSSKGLQMVSIKYLAMDEVTGYPKDVEGRGSPRDQARARQKMYGDLAKEWQGSTPGVAGECVISDDFEAGDQRYYYLPCPHCDMYQGLSFDMMRGPPEHDGPVHLRCLSCDGAILDGHKPDMMSRGHWIARRVHELEAAVPLAIPSRDIADWICPPCEGRCRDWQPSYHLWAAYAPREKLADIWQRWLAAQGDTTKMRTFCQQDLAEPYDPAGLTVDWEKVIEAVQKQALPARVIPSWAALLVSAADVQGYGIKWAVYAIGPRDQYQLIDREVFPGAPDQSDEPWISLSDALGRTYPTESGNAEKGIDLSGVDSGWATERVYRFCSGRPNVYALDGREPSGLPPLGTPVKKDIKDRLKRVVAKSLLYPVGLFDVKTAVTAAMANLVQGRGDSAQWPRNTIHLPADLCDEEFAKELTGEKLVDAEEEARASITRRARRMVKPKAGKKWMKIIGRKNDWFDATVYAYALGWHLQNKRRLNLDRWADLVRDLHGVPDEEKDLFTVADESPFVKQTKKPADLAAPKGSSRKRKKWGAYS